MCVYIDVMSSIVDNDWMRACVDLIW